jgi:predicted alpha/beta-fold hydrolase
VFNIRIPVLALHAKDDPIIANIAVPYEAFKKNPYIVMCATDIGGHIGYFELGGDRWFTKAVSHLIDMLAHHLINVVVCILPKVFQ